MWPHCHRSCAGRRRCGNQTVHGGSTAATPSTRRPTQVGREGRAGVEIDPGFSAAEVLYDGNGGARRCRDADAGGIKTGAGERTTSRAWHDLGVRFVVLHTVSREIDARRGSCGQHRCWPRARAAPAARRSWPSSTYERTATWQFGLGGRRLGVPREVPPGLVQHTIGWPLRLTRAVGHFISHGA